MGEKELGGEINGEISRGGSRGREASRTEDSVRGEMRVGTK